MKAELPMMVGVLRPQSVSVWVAWKLWSSSSSMVFGSFCLQVFSFPDKTFQANPRVVQQITNYASPLHNFFSLSENQQPPCILWSAESGWKHFNLIIFSWFFLETKNNNQTILLASLTHSQFQLLFFCMSSVLFSWKIMAGSGYWEFCGMRAANGMEKY